MQKKHLWRHQKLKRNLRYQRKTVFVWTEWESRTRKNVELKLHWFFVDRFYCVGQRASSLSDGGLDRMGSAVLIGDSSVSFSSTKTESSIFLIFEQFGFFFNFVYMVHGCCSSCHYVWPQNSWLFYVRTSLTSSKHYSAPSAARRGGEEAKKGKENVGQMMGEY